MGSRLELLPPRLPLSPLKSEATGKIIYLVLEVNCEETFANLVDDADQKNVKELMVSDKVEIVGINTYPLPRITACVTDEEATLALSVPLKPLSELEQEYIKQVLAYCGGNRSMAAKMLDINRRTLQRKISQFDCPPEHDKWPCPGSDRAG